MCQSIIQIRTKVWTTLLPDVIESELKESYQQGRKTWLKLSHIPGKSTKPLKGRELWAKMRGVKSESDIMCEWKNVDKTMKKKYDSEAIGLYMKWKWHETNYQKIMQMEVTLSQVIN